MENKNYIVYTIAQQLYFGYIKSICNCKRCKDRGQVEIFINNLDDLYLDCVKYNEKFYDNLIYVGVNILEAIEKVEDYYNSIINRNKLENKCLQSIIDMTNYLLVKDE